MSSAELHREVIKLLIQVAWADHELAEEEREHILQLARDGQLSETAIAELRTGLEDPSTLSAPDLGLLKRYKPEVMRAARVLMGRDNHFTEEEAAMLQGIDTLLSD